MANPLAIRAVEAILQHVDAHVRELLPPAPGVEVDSALMIIGAGSEAISAGVAGAWSFDFQARITGWYIQEFDGTTGSIVLGLAKAPRGPAPTFTSIVASAPPSISSGRYGEDAALAGWDTLVERSSVLRVSVTSAASFTRVLFGLRVRRLEPY
jgi:hypothetical protein